METNINIDEILNKLKETEEKNHDHPRQEPETDTEVKETSKFGQEINERIKKDTEDKIKTEDTPVEMNIDEDMPTEIDISAMISEDSTSNLHEVQELIITAYMNMGYEIIVIKDFIEHMKQSEKGKLVYERRLKDWFDKEYLNKGIEKAMLQVGINTSGDQLGFYSIVDKINDIEWSDKMPYVFKYLFTYLDIDYILYQNIVMEIKNLDEDKIMELSGKAEDVILLEGGDSDNIETTDSLLNMKIKEDEIDETEMKLNRLRELGII